MEERLGVRHCKQAGILGSSVTERGLEKRFPNAAFDLPAKFAFESIVTMTEELCSSWKQTIPLDVGTRRVFMILRRM